MFAVRLRSLLFVCAIAVVAVGCGRGTMLSPTGPTAPESMSLGLDTGTDLVASSSSSEPGAFETMGRGNGRGNSGGNPGRGKHDDDDPESEDDDGEDGDEGDDDGEEDDDRRGPPEGRHHVSGFVTAVAADSLTVRGLTVMVDASTVIRHGHRMLTLDQIQIGDHVQARGTLNGTTLLAREIKVEDTGRDNEELEGVMAGLTGTCPIVTFTLGTTTVTTSSATQFEHVECAGLANGLEVEVAGARRADGSVLAARVRVELAEVEGAISGLAGSCPALTFTVGTTTVTTNSATTFDDGACAALANGATVEVKGFRQTDGAIAAVTVELEPAEVEGVVSGLSGTCPALTLTVGTTAVTTSATTVFHDVACETIANGAELAVKGIIQAGGSIAATRVEPED
ncbi:MAG: hypothetical protein HY657_15250 [Acidobacteria bacterium]|nr:hypothetical protein [Acidobacteriota bacterium]